MSRARALTYATTLLLISAVLVWREPLVDQYYLHTFKPSGEMESIINRLDLTPAAKAMMYRSQPQVDDKTAFNKDCEPAKGELELGCYVDGRIYILRITNPSLASEMDVVGAHELLHEAYTRLGAGQKRQVDNWVEGAASQIHDDDLDARLGDYAKTEPGERDNELHSILGSEYDGLTTDLEAYYGRYFNKRSALTAAHTQYKQVFDQQKSRIDEELATIRNLKAELNSLNAQMDALHRSGRISEYNNLVPRQNSLVAQVNGLINGYNSDVDEYNALSASLNSQQISPEQP